MHRGLMGSVSVDFSGMSTPFTVPEKCVVMQNSAMRITTYKHEIFMKGYSAMRGICSKNSVM